MTILWHGLLSNMAISRDSGLKFVIFIFKILLSIKGPVKLIKRVKIAHSFLQSVRSLPRYHFKLANVILQMAVKELFETHF